MEVKQKETSWFHYSPITSKYNLKQQNNTAQCKKNGQEDERLAFIKNKQINK